MLDALFGATSSAQAWEAAHEIYARGSESDRASIIERLWSEPAGERQGALMEAVRPGTDAQFCSLLECILNDDAGAYTAETRMIACDRMTPVVEEGDAGIELLLKCLRDNEPTVRHSAVGVASRFAQAASIRLALDHLRTDAAIVQGESIGEFVAAVMAPDD